MTYNGRTSAEYSHYTDAHIQIFPLTYLFNNYTFQDGKEMLFFCHIQGSTFRQ